MKIHEYQAKQILKTYGISAPSGCVCFTVADAVSAAEDIGGSRWAVKAQIHAGGRGEGGGVAVVGELNQVADAAERILDMTLVTEQTGPAGRKVSRLLVEEAVGIRKELYLGLVCDRSIQRVVLILSSAGGTDIEQVAKEWPEAISRYPIDPSKGLDATEVAQMASNLGMDAAVAKEIGDLSAKLYALYWENDAVLAEINPLVIDVQGSLIALDAKLSFDGNALFRQTDLLDLRDEDEEDPGEIRASEYGLSYISLDGDIGCLVNGAGLAMATMDIITLYGGAPANFLDVGGGAATEQVAKAFEIMLENRKLKAILVNIFGGIMRCDVVAQGLLDAARTVELELPVVVRLEGANVEQGRSLLANAGLNILTANSMDDAARKVVDAAGAYRVDSD